MSGFKKGFVKSPVKGNEHIVEIVAIKEFELGGKKQTTILRTIGHYDVRMKICYDWEIVYKDQDFWERLLAFVEENYPKEMSDYKLRYREPKRKNK